MLHCVCVFIKLFPGYFLLLCVRASQAASDCCWSSVLITHFFNQGFTCSLNHFFPPWASHTHRQTVGEAIFSQIPCTLREKQKTHIPISHVEMKDAHKMMLIEHIILARPHQSHDAGVAGDNHQKRTCVSCHFKKRDRNIKGHRTCSDFYG